MTFQPLVSVLTPTYNHELFIDQCLRSIQSQTYENWEQIIVDDGSTDSTPNIISEKLDRRMTLLKRNHRGIERLAESYNVALARSRGELVAILEGDDTWPLWKLGHQVRHFENPEVIISWGSGMVVDAVGKSIGRIRPFITRGGTRAFQRREFARELVRSNPLIPASGVVVRKDILSRIDGFRQPRGTCFVDFPTWLGLAENMTARECAIYQDEDLVYWRSHPGQASRNYQRMIHGHSMAFSDFRESLTESKRFELGLTLAELDSGMAFFKGRTSLANGAWMEAKRCFEKAWPQASLAMKWRILLGCLAGIAHTDLFRAGLTFSGKLPEIARFLAFKR